MKRGSLLLIFLLVFNFQIKPQSLLNTNEKTFYGFHLNSSISLPVYFSVYHLSDKHTSFGLKLGMGRYRERGLYQTGGYDYGLITNIGYKDFLFESRFLMITPVYIPFIKKSTGKMFFVSLGMPICLSSDALEYTYYNDKLFGYEFRQKHHEINYYQAFELEFQYWFDLSKNCSLFMGGNTSVRFIGRIPFVSKFNDLPEINSPISARPFYANLHLGLAFSKFKKLK